jgi:uracil-DNA glycosylase
MRWTDRQRAMLREMGVRLWLPEDALAEDGDIAAETGIARVEEARVAKTPAATPPQTSAQLREASGEPSPEVRRLPGVAPADWLVVGDPLDAADPQQEQLLENMLRAIGVGLVAPARERRAVYVAIDARAAVDASALAPALDAVAPRCVLAFGRAAAAALLGADAPLGGLRGRVHAHAGVPVVVTFSLAFLLRHPAEKAKAWADLCLAVRALSA